MTPKMIVPVYHDTRDQRVIQWVNRNLTTHDLAAGRVNLVQNMKVTKGNGNIRSFIAIVLLLAVFTVGCWLVV